MDFIEAEKIAAVMRMAKPNVTVIGVGGAGSNIVSWLKERGISGGKLIAANTDAAHLSITKADRRILMGEKLTHGQGAGGYPQRGAEATRESIGDFQKETQNSNIIFLCAGLGGGTGTGAIEVLSKELARQGRLVIGVVTLPFSSEAYRYDNAKNALKVLRQYCDTVVAIENTKLFKVVENFPEQNDGKTKSEVPKFNSEEANLRIKALNDKTRREIIGILYVNGPTFHTEIAKRVGLKPNELSYHLGLLVDAGYLRHVYSDKRIGKSFSTYSVTELAIGFLDFIGAKAELDFAMKAQQPSVRDEPDSRRTHALEVRTFAVANELAGQFIKGLTETITTASLINIDYADLRAICERKGLASIGVGEGKSSDRVEVAIRRAIAGQLLDIKDVTKSQGVLVHVTGSSDLTLEEVTKAGELVTKSLPPNVRIVWGARVDPSLEGRVKCMVMLTGVESALLAQQEYNFSFGPMKSEAKSGWRKN